MGNIKAHRRNRLPSWADRPRTVELVVEPVDLGSRRSRMAVVDRATCETMGIPMAKKSCFKYQRWHRSKNWPTRLPMPNLTC